MASSDETPPASSNRVPRSGNVHALLGLIAGTLVVAAILIVVAIDRIQTTMLERDAIALGLRWTDGLVDTLGSLRSVMSGQPLSEDDRSTIAIASRVGGLHRYVIFDQNGKAIASSDPTEIGRINSSEYWTSQVLRGAPHAAIEEIQSTAPGGPAVIVAETYLPVFDTSGNGYGEVLGAFEAYVDVTESANAYRRISRYASVTSVVLIVVAGAAAMAFVWRDASHRNERERMLAAARRVADASNAAKSRFLATVSHEIRTPMSGVLATLELLRRANLGVAEREMVEVVRRSATALLDLLNQILDQSKIEAGKLEIDAAPFALVSVIEEVATVMRPAAAKKGLRLDVELPASLPAFLVGDAVRIRQILFNLVGNAIKFTDHGTVTLIVGIADAEDLSGPLFRFEVRDTGIGISEADLDRLFEPFEQAGGPTPGQESGRVTGRAAGTGLGLAISRQLAGLMDGTLTALSKPGVGSRFLLDLPLPVTDMAPVTSPSETGALARPDLDHSDLGLSVLVAEDDETNRWVLARQLETLGCRATIVDNGLEAHRLWKTDPDAWDVVLTDWHMPAMDGIDLCRRVKEASSTPGASEAGTRVVLMTAAGLPATGAGIGAADADAVLIKPLSLSSLATALAPDKASPHERKPGPTDHHTSGHHTSGHHTSGHHTSGHHTSGQNKPFDQHAEEPILDTSNLEALCGEDPRQLALGLESFLRRLDRSVEAFSNAEGTAAIAAEAHKLKGAAAAVGARRLADACGSLEARCRVPEGEDQAISHADADSGVRREIDRARTAISDRLGTLGRETT